MEKIKLSQIELLVAAVEMGSFSAASAELGCTQSRISHSIAELERSLGVRLLERTHAGCTPTQAGHRVLARAREILHLTREIEQESHDHLDLKGTVRVACIRSAATHLLPYAIETLERECPGVHLEVLDGCHSYDSVMEMLEQGSADIGITRELKETAFRMKSLVSDQYVVVAPTSRKLNSPVHWEELVEIPFIHIQQPGSEWIVEQCLESGMPRQRVREQVSESGIAAMVGRGLGYAVLPRLTVFPDVQGTQILVLPFRAMRKLVMYRTSRRSRDSVVDTVIRYIRNKSLVMKTEVWQRGIITLDF
ncbi:LysR family transcriptional regulator [Achromobacter xylosoxidans]|uniref:LysR family transcriptional regulator n=1 Tax=Alcaligenes xylosoxydans xylosoxydans TaxID=85698 RepID=UPI000B495234|nr:LysR family transcriptional regulator [Achromobacter xylosoxidans]